MEISLNGVFRGRVLDNQDPYNQERLLVSIPAVHDADVGVWANHCSPSNSFSGDVPSPGTTVFVMFLNDFYGEPNPNDCIWLGQSNYN